MDAFGVAMVIGGARFWIGAGLLTALAFLLVGIDRVAPLARGAHAFRPLLLPGIVLLWPLVILRWIALERRGGA